jgi:SAM-dependent methyltransferase
MTELYDLIGCSYAAWRQPDPRIARCIRAELGDTLSVLNVGAGAGSYEPPDLPVIAVEPSWQMISQRSNCSNVVQARAERLPFMDQSFGAAMAVLTIHHWTDRKLGLEECARVARKRVVILTWDPASEGFWLVQDYFPEMLELDRPIFPTIGELGAMLGRISVQTIPIPEDCMDGFLGAYWRRPNAYLDASVRAGMSPFSRVSDVESRIAQLRNDLASGVWERRHRTLLGAHSLDIGYRLITAELQ